MVGFNKPAGSKSDETAAEMIKDMAANTSRHKLICIMKALDDSVEGAAGGKWSDSDAALIIGCQCVHIVATLIEECKT